MNEVSGHFKDAFHEYLVQGKHDAVNPAQTGTKVGALYEMNVASGAAAKVRLRLSPDTGGEIHDPALRGLRRHF